MSGLTAALLAKASTQQLTDAIATREPTIGEGSLSQSKVSGLPAALLGKASTQQLTDAIATREPTIGEESLSQSKVQNLTSASQARPAHSSWQTPSLVDRLL